MIKAYEGTLYGNYRQKSFAGTYPEVSDFLNDYTSVGLPATISNDDATTLYYLLYAKFANRTIAASDPTRFKYDLFSRIWQFGPN